MSSAEGRALSFGEVAADYDRLRPAPAPDALTWLVPDQCELAVDLAAGTGLFTRSLVERVPKVVAIEPDARMREVFALRSPGIEAREGSGEAIPLPDAAADLVTVSSAWHWFDPEAASLEIARVLKDGGRLAVVWTHMSHDEGLPSIDWEALGVERQDRERVSRATQFTLPDGCPVRPRRQSRIPIQPADVEG